MKDNDFVLDVYEQSIEDVAETFVPASSELRAQLAAIIDLGQRGTQPTHWGEKRVGTPEGKFFGTTTTSVRSSAGL